MVENGVKHQNPAPYNAEDSIVKLTRIFQRLLPVTLDQWYAEYSDYSERLLFNGNSAIFQLYHGENKLIFNEMMMRSTLY